MNPIYRHYLSGGNQTVSVSDNLKVGYYDGTTGVYNPNAPGYRCAIFPATYGDYYLRNGWAQQAGARMLCLQSDTTGGVLALSLSGTIVAPQGTKFIALNFLVDARITEPYNVPFTIRPNEQLPDNTTGNWVPDPDRDITDPIPVAGASAFRMYASDGGNVVGGVCVYSTPGSNANGVTVGDYNNYIPEFIYTPKEGDDHFIAVPRRPGIDTSGTLRIEATPIYEPLPVPPDGWQYFTLTELNNLTIVGSVFREVYPKYKDDLSKDWELESNQRFYRAKLSGKLSFIRDDYNYIAAQPFDTEFIYRIEQSDDGGISYFPYFTGKFMKTDCEFNQDDQKITVQPDAYDQYNDTLAGLEKEYNLIELAPEIVPMKLQRRPLIQIYIPGDTVVSCFLGGNYWEQDANATTNKSDLVNKYYFALDTMLKEVNITVNGAPSDASGLYGGRMTFQSNNNNWVGTIYKGDSKYQLVLTQTQQGLPWYYIATVELRRTADQVVLFRYQKTTQGDFDNLDFTMNAVGGGATGTATAEMATYNVFARYVTDNYQPAGSSVHAYEIPTDDIVEDNRNYRYAIGYAFGVAYLSNQYSNVPTQWGIRDDGTYFVPPYSIWGQQFFPIARSTWRYASIWFGFSSFDWITERQWRQPYTLRDTNPLSSVISVLLKQFAPGITHEATEEYSRFLYGASQPIGYYRFTLMLSQKSNVLKGDYDRPAQKAPITLQQVTNMLRDCFRAFWYIEDNKFKIEHIEFFRNGGSYYGATIGTDLTQLQNIRNGKNWSFATNKWSFDKVDLAERYQFEWMDDVTKAFEGEPIQVISKYVTPGKVETINISNFTSDVDYMLLNPGDISQDGFALFAAVNNGSGLELPFIEWHLNGLDYFLQNGILSMLYIQPNYYPYDLPANNVLINGQQFYAYGIERKKKQTLNYPSIDDPDPMKLIKTGIGNGQVEKISVNLSSRMNKITLKYDTE